MFVPIRHSLLFDADELVLDRGKARGRPMESIFACPEHWLSFIDAAQRNPAEPAEETHGSPMASSVEEDGKQCIQNKKLLTR
jgi:hypothetical protein